MKDILFYLVSSIVDKSDKVEVDESEENGVINFTITVASEDMGRVIGKGGKVIKAIRNIMKIPAMKENKKVFVNLAENQTAKEE